MCFSKQPEAPIEKPDYSPEEQGEHVETTKEEDQEDTQSVPASGSLMM
jgi:hypothetical protein